jgi:arylsulfatase A-like enzyme
VRRSPPTALFALGLLGGLVAGSCSGEEKAKGPPPNVILVVWDTCRADRLSAFGHPRPTTPHLEALAAKGVRYARCSSPAPWTAPAHASLFTGLAMHRHGLEVGRGDRVHQSIPLLAETMTKAGYETVAFTANAYVSDLTGLSRGFRFLENVADPAAGSHDADRVLASVKQWLAVRMPEPAKSGPFLLFLNFMDCHLPLKPPRADVDAVITPDVTMQDLLAATAVDGPAALAHLLGIRRVDDGALRGNRARYDGAARFLDRKTAELLDLLRARGFLQNALVVVTSDHGEHLGEHGMLDHRISLYDTLLRVPLVVHRPGRYEGGAVVDAEVSLMDVYPTILAEAGVEVPAGTGLDARVLPPRGGEGRTLLGEFASVEAHIDSLRRGFPGEPDSRFEPLHLDIASARDPETRPNRRKYIRWTRGGPGAGERLVREELYDFVADPGETRDLLPGGGAAARADADRLAAEIVRMRAEGTK